MTCGHHPLAFLSADDETPIHSSISRHCHSVTTHILAWWVRIFMDKEDIANWHGLQYWTQM